MRNKGISNNKWRNVMAQERWTMETVVEVTQQDNTTTTFSEITAPVITRPLMDAPLAVGNCNSASLAVSILLHEGDVIPKAAQVKIKGRVTDGAVTSNWKTFGDFFVDKRKTSHDGRLVTLSCYDAMMKANALFLLPTYSIVQDEWPKYMSVIVTEIASRIGVTVNSDTLSVLRAKESGTHGNDYRVALPNGLSMKQILEGIAACHGGNFIITEENQLRLIKLKDMFSTSTDTTNAVAVLGDLDTGQTVTVTGVSRERDDDQTYLKSNGADGIEIKLSRAKYATDYMIDALYAELYQQNGTLAEGLVDLIYRPFTATKTVVDPAVELGDCVRLGDKGTFPVLSLKLTLDVSPYMDISAPNSEELSEEFPYLTERELREIADKKLEDNTLALFQVTRNEIQSTVSASLRQFDESGYNVTLRGLGHPDNNGYDLTNLTNGTEYLDQTTGNVYVVGLSNGTKCWMRYYENGSPVVLSPLSESLQSQITQNASAISLRVQKGSVSSELSMETGTITIGTGRLTVNAKNFTLTKEGDVSITGTLRSKKIVIQNGQELEQESVKIEAGNVELYNNGNFFGRLTTNFPINNESVMILGIESNSKALALTVNGYAKLLLNNGLFTDARNHVTEDIQLYGSTRLNGEARISGSLIFDNGNSNANTEGTNIASIFLSISNGTEATLCTNSGFYTGGNLSVIGNTTVNGSLTAGNTTVNGSLTAGNTTVNGSLTAGNTTVNGALELKQEVTNGYYLASLVCSNGVLCSNNKIHSDVGFEVGSYPVITKAMVAVREDGVLIATSNF